MRRLLVSRFEVKETEEGGMVSIVLGEEWCYVRHFNTFEEAERGVLKAVRDIHESIPSEEL